MAVLHTTGSGADGISPSTGNAGYTGSPLQSYLDRNVIRNPEPRTHMLRFGREPLVRNGYLTTQFARFLQLTDESLVTETTAAGLNSQSNTVGTTPVEVHVPFGVISVTPKQYVITDRIADFMLMVSPLDMITNGLIEYRYLTERHRDSLIQDTLTSFAATSPSNTSYAGSVSALSGFTSTNRSTTVLDLDDIRRLNRNLKRNNVPRFPSLADSFALVIHEDCEFDIASDKTANGYLDIIKHVSENSRPLFSGVITKIAGFMVFATSHIQTKTGATNNDIVYPCFALAMGAFAVLNYQYRVYAGMPNSTESDPVAQRAWYGIKYAFATKVLEPAAFIVHYCQASA